MQLTPQKKSNSFSQWLSENKGIGFSIIFGTIFTILELLDNLGVNATTSAPVLIMMQTVLLIILFVGMMIFIYNFGYIIIILTVDEGLNDEEKILLKWMIRRAIIISVLWFVVVIFLMVTILSEPYLLAGTNCFLLALIFFFIRKGENPLTEGTSI
ncbi:MAG: hypothetical protein ACTSQ9_04045 [Candidatus Hodarchaeales archaeon]